MKVSEILDNHVNQLCHKVEKHPFEDLVFYQAWSSQHYYLIQHTPRFLHLCCGMIDPSNKQLVDEFTQHLKEEMNHDALIENDMKQFSYSLSTYQPLPPTIAMIELQEHFIKTYGAVVFLGYALVLEGMAIKIGGKVAKRIFNAFGKHSKFLEVHEKADETHYPDGLNRIDAFLPEQRLKDAFVRNLKTTCFNYAEMVQGAKILAQPRVIGTKPAPESFA